MSLVADPHVPASDPLLTWSVPGAFTHDLAVLGMGYVGLPTALGRHATGGKVLGIDLNSQRLAAIARRDVDLVPSDHDRLTLALTDGRLDLTDQPDRISAAACVVICVPTPVDDHLVPDLGILRAACAMVVEHAVAGQVIILTSTTYVGCTHELLTRPLGARGLIAGHDVAVAFSPERINPGNGSTAHEDVPRVVGGVTRECTRRAEEQLAHSVHLVHPVSSPETAELTKLLENTFRAVNIALINEFADVSQELDVDIVEVIDAAATKPFGFMRFTPGPGVGGHCIPCDPHYLTWQLQRSRIQAPLISQAMRDIANRPHQVIDRVREVLSTNLRSLRGARVLVVGVAYKPNVADARESPALGIMLDLHGRGVLIDYHDPWVPAVRLDQQTLTSVAHPCAFDYDLILVHTLHPDVDLDLFACGVPVLDASYRLPLRPGVIRL